MVFTFIMKFKSFLFAVCLIILFVGCKDEKPKYGAPVSVNVYGVLGRADLDPGLKFGLFVDDPVRVENIPFNVSEGGAAVLETEVKWAFNQTEPSRFFLYAPYNSSFSGQEYADLDFPADQSTTQKILKGNLLTAIGSGNPKESSINLKVKHAMTLMTVSFDNRTGKKIKSMKVNGFRITGQMNLVTGTIAPTGKNGTITPLRASDGTDSFCFLYIPQDATPQFDVVLESGRSLSITFNNYCHEYPGSVIRMSSILLTESMFSKESNQIILELDGVNTTQWPENYLPEFQRRSPYVTLSQLNSVVPDEDNFFAVYLNKVTVTAEDNTNPEIKGVVLEDSTRAIHVWTYFDTPLKVGSTIVGPVLGFMDKPSANEINISYFYTDYATISNTDTLPCTEQSVSAVMKKRSYYEYRRMLFRDITLKKGFSHDRAVFVQDSTEFSVICPGIETQLAEGVKGDLIGFPVWTGSEFVVMVYDGKQFSSFKKESEMNSALARQNRGGMYDLSNPDTAYYAFAGKESALQFSVTEYKSGRSMQVAHAGSGEAHYFYVYDCPESPVVGHLYKVAFNLFGQSSKSGCTMDMECVKVDDGLAWFVDRSGINGLVLML